MMTLVAFRSVPILYFFSASRNEVGYWMAFSTTSFPFKLIWTEHWQDPVIIYLTKDIEHGSRKETFFSVQRTQRNRIFNEKFLHGFPFQRNTDVSKVSGLRTVHELLLQLCVSLAPWWPCSISKLAVVDFIAPSLSVQSSILL